MNKKIGAVTLLVLMSLAVALTPIAIVFGQSQSLGVEILQVTLASSTVSNGQSQYNGTVGQAFNLKGTIYTANSSYQIIFGKTVVASGNTYPEGYYVNANFTVPAFPSGSYDLTLRDVAINLNSTGTTPESFLVLTDYSISAVPSQAQEGSSVALTASVTGGVPNAAYAANVSVVLPSPLKTEYSTIVSMGTSNQDGTATGQVTYPGSSFQPSGNTTNYVGTYTVYFNQSASLAQSQFSVGFLDSTTYHRGQTVTIGATGYQPGQAAALSIIRDATGATLDSQSLTASAGGIINATWVVPQNAVIGNYNVTITPTGIQKAIKDVETFSIPGYSIQVETVNLASEIVPQILVKALDQASGAVYNGTSGSNGIVNLKLETGLCSLTAFWNGVNVGETNITVTGNGAFTLSCQLTDLKITVQNENGITLPFVNLTITYQYQPTNGGSSQTGNVSAQTDPSGTYILNSTLTGISYSINASLYNQVFNSGNNTINNLPAQALTEVVIICPNEALTINVVGYNKAAIPSASINLVELTNGLFYTATTDSSGSATSQVTFGMYRLQIYKDNILINETNIEVFGASQQQIICSLYGIQVSVSVVDFFGTPISNANVTLNGPATEQLSAMTQGDGTATFNNVIGGDMQIVAFAQGAQNSYQAVTLTVDKPTSVRIQLDRYIVLGGFLIPVSSLITIIIILVAIVLFATVEIYRRKKS
ncbi:MAG: carboxypeptidase-like regulatory domain-containing protein [Candidatus Bathyarchaeia archaeon]